jgi:hypothetical protein
MNIFLFLIIIILIIIIVIDWFMLRKWEKQIVKNLNDIFDGIKAFFIVYVIDRVFGALETKEEEDTNDDENSEEIV